jgi:hypothetical protein
VEASIAPSAARSRNCDTTIPREPLVAFPFRKMLALFEQSSPFRIAQAGGSTVHHLRVPKSEADRSAPANFIHLPYLLAQHLIDCPVLLCVAMALNTTQALA